MKKALLFLMMAVAAISCSDDGDSPSNAKLLKRMVTSGFGSNYDRIYLFDYDDANRIASVTCSASTARSYTFTYDGDLIDTMTATIGASTSNYTFTYNAQDRLTSFTIGNTNVPVNYDEVAGVYSFSYINFNPVFSLNAAGDLAMYDGRTYSYDTTKNGAIKNVQAAYAIAGLLTDDIWLYVMTRRPMNAMVIPNGASREFESTFTDGMLQELIITEENQEFLSAVYEYDDQQ